jgi:hypothetical protein
MKRSEDLELQNQKGEESTFLPQSAFVQESDARRIRAPSLC